jgi:hypothetical protein
MIVSKDIACMDSSTSFLRGWCGLRPPGRPRGTAGDGASQGLVVITARIHSRARLSSFSRSSGVSAYSANLTQSRANSSNSFADPDDKSAPTPSALSTLLMRSIASSSIVRSVGPPLSDRGRWPGRTAARSRARVTNKRRSRSSSETGSVGSLDGEVTRRSPASWPRSSRAGRAG